MCKSDISFITYTKYTSFSVIVSILSLIFSSPNIISNKVDCANGIGAKSLSVFSKRLKEFIDIQIYNDGIGGKLNENCGADFVKVRF